MKPSTVALILSLMSASISFAGGTGGGGVLASISPHSTNGGGLFKPVTIRNGQGSVRAEYVRFLGHDHSDVVFEYGQANEKNELYTEVYKQRLEEFSSDQEHVKSGVLRAQNSKDWVRIK